MKPSDDALIALLRDALQTEHAAPSPESIARLRSAVTEHFSGEAAKARRGRARLVVAISLFLGVSGSMAGAVAGGATLPVPLRAVARDVGLPVDSVGLAQAKADAGRLRGALERKDAALIPRDVAALKTSFAGLGRSDRRSIDSEVDALFDQAGRFDGQTDDEPESPPPVANPPGSGSPGTIPSTPSNDGDSDRGSTSPSTTLAPDTNGGDGDGTGGDTVAGGSSSTTPTTAPPSDSGNASPTSPTTDTSDGGGSSDGGSSVQSDGGGH